MRITTFAAWAWVVSVSLGVVPPSAAGGASRAVDAPGSFTLDDSGLILVPVSMGGVDVGACVLDTGASRTIISERLAKQLKLAAVARAQVVSSGGVSMHEVVRLPPLTLAGSTREDLFATVLPTSRMRALSDDAACVVGHDFLSTHDYTIDYERRTLSWRAAADSPDDSARLALVVREGRYVAELPQSERPGDTVRLVPDSGASDIVLFRPAGAASLSLVPLVTPMRRTLAAASGQREVAAMRLARLRVGPIELKNRPAYVIDRRTPAGDAEGLLPLNLFARVSFRHADATMMVTPR